MNLAARLLGLVALLAIVIHQAGRGRKPPRVVGWKEESPPREPWSDGGVTAHVLALILDIGIAFLGAVLSMAHPIGVVFGTLDFGVALIAIAPREPNQP